VKKLGEIEKGKVIFILIGIIAISAAMRLYRIDYQSLWVDELFSIVETEPHNSLASVIEYAKGDQPPLFFIYIHYAFKAFGYSESVGRIACALVGLISIIAIYFLVKEVQSQSAGLFAALITGFNYFHCIIRRNFGFTVWRSFLQLCLTYSLYEL